jgi:ligand-binding sensor domain-containing protein/signal transduction histidine kinase
VQALRQDQQGYIWFATLSGLARFNGSAFRTYSKEDGLSSNSVFDIAEDRRGRLMIGTSSGLCVLERGQFRCYGQADGLANDNARTVAVDKDGSVWVGTVRGLSHWNNGTIRNYTVADGLPDARVSRVVVDVIGNVWVATANGLARYDGKRFVLESPDLIGNAPIQFIAPAGQGLLIGVAGRLYSQSSGAVTPVFVEAFPDSTVFTDGAVDGDGVIWLATRNGAFRVRRGKVEHLGRDNGMPSELINRVMIDREGDVWFGTEEGASKHVPGPFRTYSTSEGLPNQFVRALALAPDGTMWVGTRNGIAVRDGERFKPVALPGAHDDRVFDLQHTPRGDLLVGTRRGLLWYVNGRVRQVYREKDGLPSDVVYSLLPDGTGGLWVGTDRGLARWNAGTLTRVKRSELASSSIVSMAMDARGRLWLGRLAGGIAILEGDSIRILGLAQGASDQAILTLREDAKGGMWVGTNGDGALRVDASGIRRLTTRDGLSSNFVWQALADSRGDVWLFGNRGLDRVSGDKLTNYGRGSGLTELEGTIDAAVEDGEGNLWFGTGAGIVRYVPGLDVTMSLAPPVYIEEVMHDGKLIPSPSDAKPVRLSHGAMQFRFSSPSFRDESAIRFRYRLIGSTDRWSEATADRSMTYPGLNPGRYRFEVIAVSGAMESAHPTAVAFVILPAFWESWWFRVLAVTLLVCATAAVPVIRSRALERERQRLEGLVEQHTHDLADKNVRLEQSNRDLEHFAYVASHDLQEPLRKIQAFSDRVTKQYSAKLDEQGRDYLTRMSGAAARMQRLIEDLLSLSRVTTKRNATKTIELRELADEVMGDLEFRLQSTNGRVELGDLPSIEGDPVQIRQVFQNLIGNALKFHKPDESPVVRVSAAMRDARMIEIRFQDNGIGFDANDAERVFQPFQRLHGRSQYEGTGIGLTICQKIAERHGGNIRAESVVGKGTCFIVTLPVRGPMGDQRLAA